jgi:hypothetical protein
MPALAAPATWRKPYAYRGYLAIDKPEAIFKARVNQATFTYPITQVTFDGVTLGAFGDIVKNMTVLFGTSDGADDLGRHRIRKAAGAATLYVGEASQGDHDGEVNLEDDAYITVLNEYRIWTIPPYIASDETIYKDYDIPYSEGGRNYGSRPGPIANGGCSKADLIDSGTAVATFEYDADDSAFVSPGSAVATVTWDVGDGTITVGNVNSAQITATFPEGRRYVDLTIEDDNGDTRIHHILTLALNESGSTLRPILDFEITDHRLAPEGGEMSVIVHEDIDPADYPEGAQCIYFEHEYYDGAQGSLAGPSGDEHIKFVGWLDTESESPTATLRGIERGVEFRIISSAERLRQVNLLPQRVDDNDSPASWIQMEDLTPERFMCYLLLWHSNVFEVANIIVPDFGSAYPGIQVQASTIYEQVDEIAKESARRFTCDQRGTLRIVDYPLLLDSGDRTGTVIVALTEADLSSYELASQPFPREYWIAASGITTGDSQVSKYSRAPGDAPGQGAARSAFDMQLVADQDDLNARAGHQYARQNTPWEPLHLRMVHTGDAGIDPALMEWVEVTTTTATNRRQRVLTDQKCLPTEVHIEHNNDGRGVKEVEYTVEIETVGTPGATYIPPTDPQFKLPDYQFPQIDLFPPTWELPTPSTVDFTSAPAMYAATLSGVYRNRDTSSISWSSIFDPTSEAGANYEVWRFRLDPWDPKNTAWVAAVSQTDEIIKIYSTDNLNDSPPTWSEEHEIDLSAEGGIHGGLDMRLSINIEGLVVVNYSYIDAVSGVNSAISYRLTPVSAWVDDEILNSADAIRMKCIGMGTHQVYPAGDVYFHTSTGFGGNRKFIYKSTDLGQNWAVDETISWGDHRNNLCLALPYLNNPNDEVIWFFAGIDDADSIFRRNADGSYTMDLGAPAASGYFYIDDSDTSTDGDLEYKLAATNAADIWTSDPNEIRFISKNEDGTAGFRQLVYSENGGATWINKSLPTTDDFVAIGSWPNDRKIIFAYGEVLYWSDDKGDNWNNLDGTGGVALSAVATDPFVFDFVPVWVP